MWTSRKRKRHKNGRDIAVKSLTKGLLCPELLRNKQMKGNLAYHTLPSPKSHTHRSITVWEAIGATARRVSEFEFSSRNSIGEQTCNSNVVRWAMWRKKVIGILGMPVRERVLRVDEFMIFERASFSSVLKNGIGSNVFRLIRIVKHSRQQNGSRRMARSDLPFIHSGNLGSYAPNDSSSLSLTVMDLTKDWMIEFWTRNWWIARLVWSLLRVILENSCLRPGCTVWVNACHRQPPQ